jgi:hypothetical protein
VRVHGSALSCRIVSFVVPSFRTYDTSTLRRVLLSVYYNSFELSRRLYKRTGKVVRTADQSRPTIPNLQPHLTEFATLAEATLSTTQPCRRNKLQRTKSSEMPAQIYWGTGGPVYPCNGYGAPFGSGMAPKPMHPHSLPGTLR